MHFWFAVFVKGIVELFGKYAFLYATNCCSTFPAHLCYCQPSPQALSEKAHNPHPKLSSCSF